MLSNKTFPLEIIPGLAKEYGLPSNQLRVAIQEGERIWSLTWQDNQENEQNRPKIQKILHHIRDYQRRKQNTLNAEVRELVTWHQTYFGTGPKPTTEAEAIEHIKFIFSRPRGPRQVNRKTKDIDLESLRNFSWPLRDLWIRLGKSWTVASNDFTRKEEYSKAEQFFLACASRLEPTISPANVRSVIMRPFTSKDEADDAPSLFDNMAMVLTPHGLFPQKIR